MSLLTETETQCLLTLAVLGGITHEWRVPEIRNDISPGSLSFEVRQLNDTWAYGKLLSETISPGGASLFSETLDHVVACLTREDTLARMTLPEAISRLRASGIDIIMATPELITEQRPERPHRSGGIQKGKVPVVLENQFYIRRHIYISTSHALYIYSYATMHTKRIEKNYKHIHINSHIKYKHNKCFSIAN